MGFLKRLLGRPGGDEDQDAGLLTGAHGGSDGPPVPGPGPAKHVPIIIGGPVSEPATEPPEVFTSRTYATEPDFGAAAGLDDVADTVSDMESASVDESPDTGETPLAEGLLDDVEGPAATDQWSDPDPLAGVRCPSCASLLDPPPERTRRCPYCREQIVVRRVDGRAVYLTEAALPVFEQERQRILDAQTWTEQRQRWLRLAANVRAPAARRARLAAAPLTAAVVQSTRTLYLNGADLAVRAARNEKRWQDVARIRREQAAALWAEAGGKVPPPTEVVDLHEEGMLAELRSMTRSSRDAELVSARCCKTCRADDGKAFRITAELKSPRLPHSGCPKGICKCEWWPTMSDPNPKSRRRAAPVAPIDPSLDESGAAGEPMPESLTSTPALTATRAETPDVSITIEVTGPTGTPE